MKISTDWLRDFLEFDLSPGQLMDTLNGIGLNVEDWEEAAEGLILELNPPANRPDILGHMGVARELGAKLDLPLKEMDWRCSDGAEAVQEVLDVQVWEEDLCPRYSGKAVKGVTIGPSEDWLQERLKSLGQNPVNNVVDAANYVLFATGHPLHTFDMDKIGGAKIVVRKAKRGESLIAIDGSELPLEADALVIADETSPLALAGILGGRSSAVSEETSNVFIESAYFNPLSILRTAKTYNLHTEASLRFEKGVDLSFTPQAAQMAAALICRNGGTAYRGMLDVFPKPGKPRTLIFRRRRIQEMLGMEVAADYVEKNLKKLGFSAERQQPDVWQIEVPPFRQDIEKEADLVEEIGRIFGYDRIPCRMAPVTSFSAPPDPEEERSEELRNILFHHGFDEIVSCGLVEPEGQTLFGASPKSISLLNPISSKLSQLRASILPELLNVTAWNMNRGSEGVHIFEIGAVHFQEDDVFEERRALGLVSSGLLGHPHWQEKQRRTDLYFIKGACETIISQMGFGAVSFPPSLQKGCDDDGALSIKLKGEKIGYIGRLNGNVLDFYSLKDPVWAAEIDLNCLFKKQPERVEFLPVTKYPSIQRDVSFVGDIDISYHDVSEALEKLGLSFLESFTLVSRFVGKPVPINKVSLSFRFVFRHPGKTLLAEEVEGYLKTIIDKLNSQFKFELREGG